ncbi:MAG: PIN domain-containing protein [Deltaproteobacteria bacterium]|nr:PIN domain-containing protein [Deltaproteobacteria bacterium]
MSDKVFVDTDILVYSRDASEPEKQQRAMAWMTHLWTVRAGRLSFQVLQEFYATVTQKLTPGLDPQSAREDVRALLAWDPIPVNERVIEGAWLIQDRYKLSWGDALIVSAAQTGDCRLLLTEYLQENQAIGNIHVINPFRVSPESALP